MLLEGKKYSCTTSWPKKYIHSRETLQKKNSFSSKISPPPSHNVSNGPSLIQLGFSWKCPGLNTGIDSDLLLDERTKGIFTTRHQAQRWLKWLEIFEPVVTQCFGAWGQADSRVDTQRREKRAKFVDELYSPLAQFAIHYQFTSDPSRFRWHCSPECENS